MVSPPYMRATSSNANVFPTRETHGPAWYGSITRIERFVWGLVGQSGHFCWRCLVRHRMVGGLVLWGPSWAINFVGLLAYYLARSSIIYICHLPQCQDLYCFFFFFSSFCQISAVTTTTGSGISSELVIRPSSSDHGAVFRCHVLHPALLKPYEVSFALQVLCKFQCDFYFPPKALLSAVELIFNWLLLPPRALFCATTVIATCTVPGPSPRQYCVITRIVLFGGVPPKEATRLGSFQF